VKNVVLCFDQVRHPGAGGATNATAVFDLLDHSERQLSWYHPGTGHRIRARDPHADARAVIHGAYAFLRRCWQPGDSILVFGAGRGGYSAQALIHLVNTVGVLPPALDDVVDHAVAAYAMPRTRRTPREWQTVRETFAALTDGNQTPAVSYLGLWDALRDSALPTPPAEPLAVVAGRHAVAAEGGSLLEHPVTLTDDRVEQAWFRGGHCDVAGGQSACRPLADIALNWVFDGAVAAGLEVRDHVTPVDHADALAGSARSLRLRRMPAGALVHASVDSYVRAHPRYWHRLPARFTWTDTEWLARGERLLPTPVAAPVATELTAIAS
jgi:uncharacterized protein (DUF2235 family)